MRKQGFTKTYAYNRRAKFDYHLEELLEGGISLLGTEVKSVRAGNMSLRGAFITIHNNQSFLTNATIPPWQVANAPSDYDPVRPRQLLLKKKQLSHLIGAKKSSGLTIIPIRAYSRHGRIKLEIALARGKRKYDKKQLKKEHDLEREVDRLLRGKE